MHCTDADDLKEACVIQDAADGRKKEYQSQPRVPGKLAANASLLNAVLGSGPGPSAGLRKGNALTEAEQQAVEAERAIAAESAARSAGDAMSGAAVGFPATDAAHAALDRVKAGATAGVVLVVDGERFEALQTLTSASAATLRTSLVTPSSAPAFAVLRVNAGTPEEPLVLVSFCPDEAPIRMRMIHSSAKPALRAILASKGIDVAKSLETQDAEDITDTWLMERVIAASGNGGPSAEHVAHRRPAPKGGRRLLPTG